MSQATPRPITNVFPHEGSCALHVDRQGREYRICWSGDWRKPPDLSSFPAVTDATVTEIPHGPAAKQLWSSSHVISHGSDAHIREMNSCQDGFPICKVAIDARQRASVSEEFQLMRFPETNAPDIPIPRVHTSPLREGADMLGFRMEKLHEIPLGGHLEHFGELETAVRKLREYGIVHFDLSPNNIMLDGSGNIRLIDFGRAGRAGQNVPAHKARPGAPQGAQYSCSVDAEDLGKLHGEPRPSIFIL